MLDGGEDDGGEDHPISNDLMFDPWAESSGPALAAASGEIAARVLSALTQRHGKRKPRRELVEGTGAIVSAILANLLALVRTKPAGARLVVSMRRDARTRYDRPGFRKLPEVVAAMAVLGFVIRYPAEFRKKRTAIEPRGDLKERLLCEDMQVGDIARAEGEEVIQVTARPPLKRVGGRKVPKVWIDYEDTEESIRLRSELEAINRFLCSRTITFRGNPMPAFRLVRRFGLRQIGDPVRFSLHGRLYGGFWMTLKAAEREHLRIDGEPIADLDFSGMFPNLAYRYLGKEPPAGDLYAIPGLEQHRDGAKAALSALLSYDAEMKSLPPRLKAQLPKGWTAGRLKAAVAKKHPDLVPLFGSDFAMDLMFTESRITATVMLRLIEEEIVGLPMHDGLMVAMSRKHRVRKIMRKASEVIAGVALPISEKTLDRGLHPASDLASCLPGETRGR